MDNYSICAKALAFILVILYVIVLFRSKARGRVLRTSALLILLAGTAVYMWGYTFENYNEGIPALLLRSLVSSAKMFIYSTDLCEVVAVQKEPFFLDVFMLVFCLAMLTSVSAIIMLFGKRAGTFMVLKFRKRKFQHIFLGTNPRSQLIASGIRDQEIAFIEFPEESDEDRLSVESVLRSISDDDANDGMIPTRHITLLRAKHKLSHQLSMNAFEQMGLEGLKRLVGPDTAFYLLSDDSERNLHDLLALESDESIQNNIVHACVRREGLAKSYQGILGKTGAHFIFPSSLSVVDLMKNEVCHPANVMSLDRDAQGHSVGAADGQFNALIVGFGETGQAALKFIYEFSSAVMADGTPLPVKIYVNDSQLDRLKGQFVFSCPDMEHDDMIVYDSCGLDSGSFWKTLLERLDSLNYIEISMNDDAVNMELAFTIFSYVEKKRRNGFDNLLIAVRKRHTPEYERRLLARLNEKAGREVIVFFGENEKIFTPEMIVSKSRSGINASATSLADRIRTSYEAVAGAQVKSEFESGSFHEKRQKRMETHQYISRANHIPTKRLFCDGEMTPEILERMAIAEHLRYSRYLLAHGYSFAPDDDDVLKTNRQLCSWSELSEQDRQYHRNMVRASMGA